MPSAPAPVIETEAKGIVAWDRDITIMGQQTCPGTM